MSELTVEKIKAYLKEFDGKSTIGDRLIMELPPEHNDVIVHAPVEIYKFLLDKLATIERETAEKCAQLAVNENCGMDACCARDTNKSIRYHFKLGEQP